MRKTHVLIDRMDETPAVNQLLCCCGVQIHPDCDISLASINEAFERHLNDVGGAWAP